MVAKQMCAVLVISTSILAVTLAGANGGLQVETRTRGWRVGQEDGAPLPTERVTLAGRGRRLGTITTTISARGLWKGEIPVRQLILVEMIVGTH